MGNEETRYNGWKNYETWCVHLWLTNDEGSYRYWREEAERLSEEARECDEVQCETWSVAEARRFQLAEQLKSELEEASPLEEASLFADLLGSALSEVDWHEVADAFLEEVELDDESEDDDEASEVDEDDEEAYTVEEFERLKRTRIENSAGPLFELGRTVSTPGALSTLTRDEIGRALARHHRGDWGDVGRFDWRRNEEALAEGDRLISVYRGSDGTKFWVITEADRSSTCVLLPDEY